MSLEAAGLLLSTAGAVVLWLVRPPSFELDETGGRRMVSGIFTRWTLAPDGYMSGSRLKHYLATARALSNVGWALLVVGFLVQLVAE